MRHVTSNSFANNVEVDISWDFEGTDKGGWANATAEEMQMDVTVEGGELRGSVRGLSPRMDSPIMFLQATRRHYVVVRMMYFGGAEKGQLLLRYGTSVSNREHRDFSKAAWENKVPAVAVAASGNTDQMPHISDDSLYTMWSSGTQYGSFVVLDVQSARWITSLKITSSGDENSPKKCLLQKSLTSGAGPFVTVTSFTLEKSTKEQQITGFDGHARYWRLLVLDNYHNSSNSSVTSTVMIRDIRIDGYEEGVGILPFDLDNSGEYVNYYLPISEVMLGALTRMRIQLMHAPKNEINGHAQPTFRQALAFDYIRVVRAPEIWRVRGCLDKYFHNKNQQNPYYNVTTESEIINNRLPIRFFTQNRMDLPYASTFDCSIEGGEELQVDGYNFGPQARVFIGGNECPVTSFSRVDPNDFRLETLKCRIPAGLPGLQELRVQNGILPGILGISPYFSYRTESPAPAPPQIKNIGATRVDLVWEPPGNEFDHMKTTGYKIIWFRPQFRSRVSNLTVGNVTKTSIRGLEPATQYVFAIAALAEGGSTGAAKLPTDLYGRRGPKSGYMISPFSIYTEITATVPYDFEFSFFSANNSLNHSGVSMSNVNGPTGDYGSQGHFGLVIVGSAQVENCNASSTCCDGYDPLIGESSCGSAASVCAVLLERRLNADYVVDGVTRREVPFNIPYEDGGRPEKVVLTLDELIANQGAERPSIACGPSLRLTSSFARESGAMWYRRKQNVREGFDTTIKFQIANPSYRCNILDDVNTYCRSRGADGFAFVIQNESPVALGLAGRGLGYEGINNALAIEVDTYSNFDEQDYYENHIAVMTMVIFLQLFSLIFVSNNTLQGWRTNITANHSRSLATTTRVPDLTNGEHTIRIRYDPNFDETAVPHPSFQTNGYTTFFLEVLHQRFLFWSYYLTLFLLLLEC